MLGQYPKSKEPGGNFPSKAICALKCREIPVIAFHVSDVSVFTLLFEIQTLTRFKRLEWAYFIILIRPEEKGLSRVSSFHESLSLTALNEL